VGSVPLALITVIGLALGWLIANRIAKNSILTAFGSMACGAIPGIALQCGEPWYMLTLVLVLPLMWLHYRHTSQRRMSP
jgi:hypothetical protein